MKIADTCPCGAALDLYDNWTPDAQRGHSVWLEAHAACRQQTALAQINVIREVADPATVAQHLERAMQRLTDDEHAAAWEAAEGDPDDDPDSGCHR